MSRSTLKSIGLKPLGVKPIAGEELALSGLITMPSPIKVVKDNKVITEYRDPTQNWHDELGNYVAAQNIMKKKVEQGSIPGFDPSQLTEDDTPPVRPGNTKMQDFRAKGEAIINKAKQEGRMLSEIEQMKVKRMRRKYENEYKKNK
jgi:hypothetical protein